MPNITSVTLTAGVPTAGTGTVGTLDNVTGTAGSPSVPVLTVQGVASGTPQPVSGTVTVTGTVTANAGTGTLATSLATLPALVTGSAIVGRVGIDQTTDGTTNKVAADVRLGGTAADKGSGTGGTATQRVIVDSSQLSALGQTTMSASAPVAIANDQSALKTNPVVSATANGGTPSRIVAAASTNATLLKASAGQIYKISVFNTALYNVFLKLYNKASAPTVGTDTPVMTIPIQAGGGYSDTWSMGLPFSTGIAYAITKLQADTDTTVVVAGDLTGNTLWI